MTPIQVIGIGLDGAAGLSPALLHQIETATLLVGSSRHVSYFPDHPAERLVLGVLTEVAGQIAQHRDQHPQSRVVVLTSGDPLFFGLGRLLLMAFPAEQLSFHPHLSSMQLAFSRIKLPWQDATLVSAHGRSLDELIQVLQRGAAKIAVLTDGVNSPGAIARLIVNLNLPATYQLWVCENLGGAEEFVESWCLNDTHQVTDLCRRTFDPLNVVVLVRQESVKAALDLQTLPQFGIADQAFLTFSDRPGLMTKREVRVQILGELELQPDQIVWDIGAGTGSVAIEIARLCPTSQVYAIEKTAAGVGLIQQNCQRFQISNVVAIAGSAPESLEGLPRPHRVFIGGSGDRLPAILTLLQSSLTQDGKVVLALATVEHLSTVIAWLQQQSQWQYRLLQVQLSRSVPVGPLTRFSPLNPVTLLTLQAKEIPEGVL